MSFKDFIEGIRDVGSPEAEVTEACDELVDKFYPLQCKKCGSKFPEKAKFCVDCGERLQ